MRSRSRKAKFAQRFIRWKMHERARIIRRGFKQFAHRAWIPPRYPMAMKYKECFIWLSFAMLKYFGDSQWDGYADAHLNLPL